MIHDDSYAMKSFAKKMNKKEGHEKAKTIALEKRMGESKSKNGKNMIAGVDNSSALKSLRKLSIR